ncbi:ABC transporter substrate-binding protein [Nonomuraea jiangxiensis]|uniref:Peptide/nickel transport system substrate-binding protein n=1 Tax=Nonomuraea jiangxiensis TaxID=633440 RepID=A0A1G8WNH3_9ACTN|nr:ABC transporter substrate-binding protein [Nonomuraea jiangxiensis]SDJ79711.1 peptide/nickel transport system substrate-binding protein [Nonomuraea jiangxiensis]
MRRATLLAALAALTLSGACAPSVPGSSSGTSGSQAPAASADRLTIGTTADVVNYNPLVGNSRTDSWVTDLMYPHLTQMDEAGKRIPYLATEWSYSEDGKTATATLRDDMKWTDGKPVTADDVAFTVNAVKKENFGVVAGLITALDKAEAVSPTEVRFHLTRPDGTFLDNVGFWLPVVPKHVFEKAPSVQKFANDSNWVSAGPFNLTKVERGQRYVMDRVADFGPGQPTIKQVVFRVFPDVNTEVLALRNGEIDLIGNVLPPATAAELKSDPKVKLQQIASLGWAHLQYNTKRKPMDDVRVRQALAHAVDYEAIRTIAMKGFAKSSNSSVLTPSQPAYMDPTSKEYTFDPELSKKLLAEAGVSNLTLGMIYDQADPNIARWAPMVRDSAKKAGITINLQGLERNTYVDKSLKSDFDIYAGSWAIMDNPPANLGLAFKSGGFINYGKVTDPKLDDLIDQSQRALSPAEAKAPIQQAARIIHDQVYDNVLYVETFNIAYSTGWTGFKPMPSELLSILNPLSLAAAKPAG